MTTKPPTAEAFQRVVWEYFTAHPRQMPWREPEADGSFDPYKILVSEVMLQQTQVSRVEPKFQQFIALFPEIKTLAAAPLAEVLRLWSGLGYNRRAKFLWQAAQLVEKDFSGEFPRERNKLMRLPGVGVNTAGAIMAYAYNLPAEFLETNIRTVLLHHFFPGRTAVADAELKPILHAVLPTGHVREWYWALMDYGSYLKKSAGNKSRYSKHYAKQSPLQGSRRQIRGNILRYLSERAYTAAQLRQLIPDERLASVLTDLENETLIHRQGARYYLGG